MRHRRAADLLGGERFRDLADLASLQLPHVVGEIRHDPERGDAGMREVGPPFRRHDLGAHRCRVQRERCKEAPLERARVLGEKGLRVVRTDRTGELPGQAPRREAKLLEPIAEA